MSIPVALSIHAHGEAVGARANEVRDRPPERQPHASVLAQLDSVHPHLGCLRVCVCVCMPMCVCLCTYIFCFMMARCRDVMMLPV